MFVWIGKKASQQERTEAMRNGQGFAKKKGYPPTTNVLRVIDGGEPSEFKSLFRAWKDRDQTTGMGSAHSGKKTRSYQAIFKDVWILTWFFQSI